MAAAPGELQRLHVGAALHHWHEADRATRAESVHAIPVPLWIEFADGVDLELTIAFSRQEQPDDAEVAAMLAPRKRSARKKRAR